MDLKDIKEKVNIERVNYYYNLVKKLMDNPSCQTVLKNLAKDDK